MSEWWTYRLSAVWPAQLVAGAAGLALVWLAATQGARAARTVAAALALAWLWVGWAFHWERYATINWAALFRGGVPG